MLHFYSNTIQERFIEAVNSLNLANPGKDISEKTGATEGNVSMFLNSKRLVSDNFLKSFCKEFGISYEDVTSQDGHRLKRGEVKKDKEDNDLTPEDLFPGMDGDKPVTTKEVAAMYIGIIQKLNSMHLNLSSGLQIGKVNNSLIQTVLLNYAQKEAELQKSANSGKVLTADKIFEASLSCAQKLLEGTFGK